MNICYIFGSLDATQINPLPDSLDFVIAADKGFLNTERLNIKPDFIVGDFDSLQYIPAGDNVIKHPVMKDDTDLLLAIKTGLEKDYKTFKIYGCLGGERLDHTIATIQAAAYIKENGGSAMFYDGDTTLSIHKNEILEYPAESTGLISVFSYTEKAVVTIKGLLYELENVSLSQNYPLGVSNEFTGKNATITIHSGTVLIITKEKK